MLKFKVLKLNEHILIRLGIFSRNIPSKPIDAFFKSAITYYIILIAVLFIVSSIVFVYQNSAQFNETLRTCSIIFETLQAFGMYMSFGLNSAKIHAVHQKLQALVDDSGKGIPFISEP